MAVIFRKFFQCGFLFKDISIAVNFSLGIYTAGFFNLKIFIWQLFFRGFFNAVIDVEVFSLQFLL